MKVSVIRLAIRPTTFAAAIGVNLLIATKVPAQAIAPAAVASPPPAQMTTGATAEVERVIVTGSNIPTAEETGPNPVDTYRPADMEKLGIRNATDLLTNLPQEMGTTSSQTNLGGGDGAVIPNLRGLLPKETLVLIDGKRVAIVGSGGTAGSSSGSSAPGVDINLIPFPMIDHIDILKDGASAVYGSDAVAGVINIFLIHKFRGLEIGGSMGTQTWAPPMMRVNLKAGSKPAREMTRLISWLLPIFTIALRCTVAIASLPVTRSRFRGVGLINAAGFFPAGLEVSA